MQILIALKGSEPGGYFRRIASLIPWQNAERIILAHVIDTGPRDDLDRGRERYFRRRAIPAERGVDLERAEEERARAGLAYGREALRDAGIPEDSLTEVVLRGKPNEALRGLLTDEQIELVVVGGRGGKPGPHSVGKTARFVIDHAPGAALLVR